MCARRTGERVSVGTVPVVVEGIVAVVIGIVHLDLLVVVRRVT
jgi:hypothetical protein